MIKPRCPLDGGKLIEVNGNTACESCNTIFPKVELANGRHVLDLRCLDRPTEVTLTFTIPQTPLQSGQVDRFGAATNADFRHPSREKIRKLYGTKLQKEFLYYIDTLLDRAGTAAVLDLGCGSGGNKKYLESIGFQNVISVDYMAPGAEYLVDAHRLPFAPGTFDLVLTTATLEHFYNPYIAFKEISRVLKHGGILLASGSFWESWHGNSCFHFTPGGLDLLCRSAGLELIDLWPGWGFIPSVASHALGLGRFKRVTYLLQGLFDFTVSILLGRDASKRHKFKTGGSFGLCAQKPETT